MSAEVLAAAIAGATLLVSILVLVIRAVVLLTTIHADGRHTRETVARHGARLDAHDEQLGDHRTAIAELRTARGR